MSFEAYEFIVIIGKPQDKHCLFPCDNLPSKRSTSAKPFLFGWQELLSSKPITTSCDGLYKGHSMSNQHKKTPYPHRFERNLVFTQCLLRY